MRLPAVAALLLALLAPTLSQARTASGPVVLLGASVVQFWTDADPAFFTAHPDYRDEGVAGEPLASTVERAKKEVMPLRPRVLVVITGGVAGAPERTVRHLEVLNAMAKETGARLVVAGSPSIRAGTLVLIRDYAGREGLTYVDFADMRDEAGRVKPGLTYDGVHPTAAGYALMAPAVVAGVDRALAER